MEAIRTLSEAGQVVVAVGGGGVPVVHDADGIERGIEAVVDKDRASVVLATALSVDFLVNVTAVTHVALGFGTPEQRNLTRMTVTEAREFLGRGEFGVGSMKPKIESLLSFLEAGGTEALITSPGDLRPALEGGSGTRVVPD